MNGTTERNITLMIVFALATLAVIVVGGGIYLAAIDKTIPDALIAIGAGAAGALGGALIRPNGT